MMNIKFHGIGCFLLCKTISFTSRRCCRRHSDTINRSFIVTINSSYKKNKSIMTRRHMSQDVLSLNNGKADDDDGDKKQNSPKSGDDGRQPIICHLNHAGASPSPKSVTDRVIQHLELENKVGGYAAASMVEKDLDNVYEMVAKLIHARDSSEIALVESATVAWTRAFYSMVEYQKRRYVTNISMDDHQNDRPVILISDAEYAANVVAVCQWARDNDWLVLSIPSTKSNDDDDERSRSTGIIDVKVFDDMLSGIYHYEESTSIEGKEQMTTTTTTKVRLDPSRIVMVCITHVPTNSGIVNPVEQIGHRIVAYNDIERKEKYRINSTNEGNSNDNDSHHADILYLVDACQSVGQLDVNVQKIHCHALVATGRKYLRGPRGTGFLYISSSLLTMEEQEQQNQQHEGLIPNHIDHYGVPISKVPAMYKNGHVVQNMVQFHPRHGAKRFEFWESNISNRLGLGEAIRIVLEEKGIDMIEKEILDTAQYLKEKLLQARNEKKEDDNQGGMITIHHYDSITCGIVTFYIPNVDSKLIKEQMQHLGYDLSVVPATSTPLDSAIMMKVPDLVRVSVSYVTTRNDIDQFARTLLTIL